MDRVTQHLIGLAVVLVLSACATPTRYSWGRYDGALYNFYKHPGQGAEYMSALKTAIDEADKKSASVAPGMYAEYGYMLMATGEFDEAVRYYELEKKKWPESSQFMDAMIKSTRLNTRAANKGNP